jgi:cysteinyl-tRNA synthetase
MTDCLCCVPKPNFSSLYIVACIGPHSLSTCQATIDAALRDDFDTPAVLRALQLLVSTCHLHFRASSVAINVELIASIAHFIARTLDLFGLSSFSKYCSLSPLTHQRLSSHTAAHASPQSEIDVARLVQELVQFRSFVRASAIQLGKTDAATTRKTLLDACDSLRDGSLVDLGVWLKDGKDGVAEFQILGADGAKERQKLLLASSKSPKMPKSK